MRSRGRKRRPPFWRIVRRWLGGAALLLLFAVSAWTLWINHRIQWEFEGRRWALPARLYARPLELYPGKVISPAELVTELAELGYRRGKNLSGPGQYRDDGAVLHAVTRGFTFWDGSEPSRAIAVHFSGGRIARLTNGSNTKDTALVRLEPLELARIHPGQAEDRMLVKVGEVPSMLIKALLAAEDRAFFHHVGLDPRAILRALFENLKAGELRQGGSTLTQQLVKNFYLSTERTWWRKLNEALMALLLEWHYSKNAILEAYLNEIFLGQDGMRAIHGFGLAAQFYFARPLGELAEHELALLVALVRGASYYDPRRHPERAVARRNHVLALMAERDALDVATAQRLARMALGVVPRSRGMGTRFPAFTDLVRRQLRALYPEEVLQSEGLRVFTTLDPLLQLRGERALAEQVQKLERERRLPKAALEGTMVVARPDNGEVLALIGGRRARYPGYNRALTARRPIGSLVKPAIYLSALARPARYSVVTPLLDAAIDLRDAQGRRWAPQNFHKVFHGWVPLYEALARSYNAATVRLGMDLGLRDLHGILGRLGVGTEVPSYPAAFLGAIELSPFEITQMYQTIASGGFKLRLRSIREVMTREGRPLHRYGLALSAATPPAATFLVKFLLTEVVRSGTASALAAAFPNALPLAGKTGTTSGLKDSWYVGFGEDLLATIWIGRDDNGPTGLSGATGAMRVWQAFMRAHPPRAIDLSAPRGVAWYWVEPSRPGHTDPGCPGAQRLPFIVEHRPDPYRPCGSVSDRGLSPSAVDRPP